MARKKEPTRLSVGIRRALASGHGLRPIVRPRKNSNKKSSKYQFRRTRAVGTGGLRLGNPIIPKDDFRRLVRHIRKEIGSKGVKFSKPAYNALQEDAEAFLVRRLELANFSARHDKRETVQVKDMESGWLQYNRGGEKAELKSE